MQPMGHLGLGFGKHCQQNIPSLSFGNQKLAVIAPQSDMKGISLRQVAW
jgi:hypothetical protein